MTLFRPAFFGLALALLSLGALAQEMTVEIYNNTGAELCVDGTSRQNCQRIAPKQSGPVLMRAVQWIQLGREYYRYNLPRAWFKPGLKLQLEEGGNLYRLPPDVKTPAAVLPPQPTGFPLSPTRKVNRT